MMRRAKPDELRSKVVPVLHAHLTESELKKVFDVPMSEMDPFTEPEPSAGALVQLTDGSYVVVVHGKVTGTLTMSLPEETDVEDGIAAFLDDVPLTSKSILWRKDAPAPRQVARRKV